MHFTYITALLLTLFYLVYFGESQITTGWTNDNSILLPHPSGRLSYASSDDDKFYIFAGSNGNFRWNPSSPSLVTVLSDSKVISHCWSECAAFMPDKKIYLMGMEASGYGAVEIFDTQTNEFINHTNITIQNPLRVGCVASDYKNGLIYYYGGQDSDYQTTQKIYTTLQVYNIYTQMWTQLRSNNAATTPLIRTTCQYTPNGNGYIYVFGGADRFDVANGALNDAYRYDIQDDSWAKITANSILHNAVLSRSIYNSGDGKIYILGGKSGGDNSQGDVKSLDPQTNTFAVENAMYTPVSDFAVNIYNGIIRVWGGRTVGETQVQNTQFATITTSEPTTSPTTSEPTTSNPTTGTPTSISPTTSNPTTANPTTDQPTTVQPTTSQPSTYEPSNTPTSAAIQNKGNANHPVLDVFVVVVIFIICSTQIF